MKSDPVAIELPELTGPQLQIVRIHESGIRAWDVEGAPRSAKSWGTCIWIWLLAWAFPGIQIFYCRYKQDDLIQLRDIWSKVAALFPAWAQPTWNAEQQAFDFPNGTWTTPLVYTGSRVYLSSLKPAGAAQIHSKYKGKTLAIVVIEEASEVPRSHYLGLKERLSQSRTPDNIPRNYPLHIVLVHNSVDRDHWIAKEFPLGAEGHCTRPHHGHIRADLYSNAQNLGESVIAGYETDHPIGDPQRVTAIEGKRGASLTGTPVYGFTFRRPVHVMPTLQVNPFYPLLEGWDFGQQKPAVVWAQYLAHLGRLVVVGAVRGSEMFLEQFAPRVLGIRRRLFPQITEVRSWCDPTGMTGNGGMQYTPVSLLHQLNIPAQPARDSLSKRDANDIEVRDRTIQVIAALQRRRGRDGLPAFLMTPTCVVLERQPYGEQVDEVPSDMFVAAFEVGYVWSEQQPTDQHPNIRRPLKGTPYDDLMNALEYIVTGERVPLAPSVGELVAAQALYQTAEARKNLNEHIASRLATREEMRDTHPVDSLPSRRTTRLGRRSFY